MDTPYIYITTKKQIIFKRYYSYIRHLIKLRISRQRREFGLDGISFIERDAGESNMEIKIVKSGHYVRKKVLEMGLQAAN